MAKIFLFSNHVIKDGKKNRKVNIYKVKRNIPTYIGSVSFCYGISPGSESVVLKFLTENGYLPKKHMNDSLNEWRGAGFYAPEVSGDKFRIIEIF